MFRAIEQVIDDNHHRSYSVEFRAGAHDPETAVSMLADVYHRTRQSSDTAYVIWRREYERFPTLYECSDSTVQIFDRLNREYSVMSRATRIVCAPVCVNARALVPADMLVRARFPEIADRPPAPVGERP